MRKSLPIVMCMLVVLAAPAAVAGVPAEPTIQGQYVEVRSCDVFTGQCFANGEMWLTGEEATLAWDVTEGSWNGVALDGLKVLAVVKANGTLGNAAQNPFPAKSILIIDERADESQRAALTDFVKDAAGRLVENVVRVDTAPIEFSVNECSAEGCAVVKAEGLVDISARCLVSGDEHCSNAIAFYQPLTQVDHAVAHHTVLDRFSGEGLGVTWDDSGRNSTYLASFSR